MTTCSDSTNIPHTTLTEHTYSLSHIQTYRRTTHIESKLILYGDIFVKETEKISTISITP